MPYSFVLTGGGSGGHVFPALAVARVLRERGHRLLFIGTREGMESRLVPEAGFEMEFIRIGALNRVGRRKQFQTAAQLPLSVGAAWRLLRRFRPRAVFSTGGYVAGPVMLAAVLAGIPFIVMEPNAIPGLANRKIARRVYRALVAFEATCAWFPRRAERSHRAASAPRIFRIAPKRGETFTIYHRRKPGSAHAKPCLPRKLAALSGKQIADTHRSSKRRAEHESLAREFPQCRNAKAKSSPSSADMAGRRLHRRI